MWEQARFASKEEVAAMSANVPEQRPRLSTAELQELLVTVACDPADHALLVVGVRGYYSDQLGKPKSNDRNFYDDAIFVHTPFVTAAYNGNTDPSSYRKGYGKSEKTKGMASLKPGLWPVYRFGLHGKSKYFALCQTGGEVTVVRDGDPPYDDTGYFGINIHRARQGSGAATGRLAVARCLSHVRSSRAKFPLSDAPAARV
jgi:hypothetical protein